MNKCYIIVAGSRHFNDYSLVKNTLNDFCKNFDCLSIISGTAKGADILGERYAIEMGIHLVRCPADWKRYHKGAGAKRNEEMAKMAVENSKKGVLFAFWDGVSKGTKQMISVAQQYGLEIHVINI